MKGLSRTIGFFILAISMPALASSSSEQPRRGGSPNPAPRSGGVHHPPAPGPGPTAPRPGGATPPSQGSTGGHGGYRGHPGYGGHRGYYGGYGGYGGYRSHYNVGWGWGWGGWGVWGPGWWYDPYPYGYAYPWGYGAGWGSRAYVPGAGGQLGALDLDVSPERAEVWVDGERVGICDDYDGFPDYLYLEKGTYDVAFYMPGYKTLAMQITVRPGVLVDVENRMERGEAVLPSDLGPSTHVQRDLRLERDREAQEEARRAERSVPQESLDARAEPGRLRVAVSPGDASVYLDGRFLGTGSDLAALRAGLLVDAGEHMLEVVRPGYRAENRTLSIQAGEQSEIDVALERAAEPPVN